MKRSVRIMAAGLAASLALVSCAKQDVIDNGSANPAGGARTIAVSFANASVKSELNGFQPKFVAGDKIKVSNGTDAPVDCTVSIDGSGNATITTELTGTLTMVYPAAAAKMNGNAIEGILVSTVQDGTFASANICKAEIAAGAVSATFENQTAVLRFYVDASIGVKSLKIEGTSNIATDGTIITVDPEGDVTLDSVTDGPDKRLCYVSVLSGVNANTLTLTSETTTQGTVTRPKPMADVELAAGTMYNAFIPYYIKIKVDSPETYQKWAYCNVGAFLPEEYGDYFMWGAVEKAYSSVDVTKSEDAFTFGTKPASYEGKNTTWDASKGFNWENAIYTDGVYSTSNKKVFTKYTGSKNTYAKSGTADGKTVLDLEDDAANVNWGGSWRMPTMAELGALIAITNKAWDDDKKGYTFGVSPAQIFLPAAGIGEGTGIDSAGEYGYYRSSSLSTGSPYGAYALDFYDCLVDSFDYDRYNGLSVRPFSE